MRGKFKEIELQTYSKSYACQVSPFAVPSLPYHWDGECHLVINDNFYSHSPRSPVEVHQPEEVDFDVSLDAPYEKMEDCSVASETYSVAHTLMSASTNSTEPNDMRPPVTESADKGKFQSLDAQLDFIMETSKKHPKISAAERKHKRNRKTPQQLDMLMKELDKVLESNFDKEKIRDVAIQTGLAEIQVYKWYWDHKSKS